MSGNQIIWLIVAGGAGYVIGFVVNEIRHAKAGIPEALAFEEACILLMDVHDMSRSWKDIKAIAPFIDEEMERRGINEFRQLPSSGKVSDPLVSDLARRCANDVAGQKLSKCGLQPELITRPVRDDDGVD